MTFVGSRLDKSGESWAEHCLSQLDRGLKVIAWLLRHCHKPMMVISDRPEVDGDEVGEVQLGPALPSIVCDCSEILLRETRARWAEYS